jgi:hypothetical protein
MCMCMDVWGIYMVANLILLCSLKIYLSFWNLETNLQEDMGYLIYFFHFFSILFFLFFMNNFCIATCLFSVTKLLRDNKNLKHLFRVYPIGYIFGVHSQCRSKIYFGWILMEWHIVAPTQCRNSAYVDGVYVILILRAWQTSYKASTKLD